MERENEGRSSRRSGVAPPFRGRGRAGAIGTSGASVGTVALLANRSNRFCRSRRYSSSLLPCLVNLPFRDKKFIQLL